MGGGGAGAQHGGAAHRGADAWEVLHVRRREGAGARCLRAAKLGAVWTLVVGAAWVLCRSPNRPPAARRDGRGLPAIATVSQQLALRELHRRRDARQPPALAASVPAAAPRAQPVVAARGPARTAPGETAGPGYHVAAEEPGWVQHGKCVGSLCDAPGYLINGGGWARRAEAPRPHPLAAADNSTTQARTPSGSAPAGSSQLSWFDLGRLFGSAGASSRGRYAPHLAGWLQHVPGARPDSLEYSSAGPGWLGYYMGQLTPTTGKKMNMHLHRLLFEACESSTMDFSDAKNCMATHGRSARAAMDFLRDIPDIRIDNSKSETAHYVYGSDPYLLGEDWPRSSVSVSDAVRRPYRRPTPSRARSGSDVGPPLPAAAASDQGSEENAEDGTVQSAPASEETASQDAGISEGNSEDSSEESSPPASCPVLFVTVDQAMHLPFSTVTGRAPSTYAQVQIGNAVRKTETVPESASPIWDRQV